MTQLVIQWTLAHQNFAQKIKKFGGQLVNKFEENICEI